MSMAEAIAPAIAEQKNVVMHDTWGHLFPKKPTYYGCMRILCGLYGDIVIIDEDANLPEGSPWWNTTANDFAYDMANDMEAGEVAEFSVVVNIIDHKEKNCQWEAGDDEADCFDEWQTIEIKTRVKTILIKPF